METQKQKGKIATEIAIKIAEENISKRRYKREQNASEIAWKRKCKHNQNASKTRAKYKWKSIELAS